MSGRGLQVLAYQKERIQVLCCEQGRQIESLKKLIRTFDTRKSRLQKCVECVDEEWVSLNVDVQKMCKAALPAHDHDEHDLETDGVDEIYSKKPFLQRLLQGGESQKIKEVQDMLTNQASSQTAIEASMEEKMADTRMALTCVLDYICKQDLKRLNNKVKGYMNEDQREEFKKETHGLQNKVNSLQALYRTAEDQVRQVQNLYFDTQQRNKELDLELEGTRKELQEALNIINALDPEPETGQKAQKAQTQSDNNLNNKKGPPDLSEHIQAAMKEKGKEFESTKSKLQNLQRKLGDKRKEFDGAAWIKHSKQFKQLQQRLQDQTDEKEKIQSQIAEVEREMVYVRHLDNQHKLKIEECERLKQEIGRLRDFQIRVEEDLGMERKHEQDILGNIRGLKTTVGDERTLAHWKLMFQALEDQRQTLDYKNKQIEDQCERIIEVQKNIQDGETYRNRVKAENERLRSRLKDRESRIMSTRENNRKLEDKVFEMDYFINEITNFKTASRSNPPKSESPDIQNKIKILQQRLKGIDSGEKLQQLEEREQKLYTNLQQSQQESDESRLEVFKLKKQSHRLRQQLQQSQDECSYYLNEIEVTGKGYENMVTENKELQRYMEAKNEEVSHLILEKQRVGLDKEQVSGQLKQLQANIVQHEQERQQQQEERNKLLDEFNRQQQEFGQDQQNAVALQQQINETKIQQTNRGQEIVSKNIVFESMQDQNSRKKRRLSEIQSSVEESTQKRAKTEEENTNMKRALLGDEVGMPGGNRSANDVFRQLKCSVCYSRQKSTILVRCLHTFCKECINRCLETRQRRCPKCKTGFTNNEVKPFSLD